MATYFYTDEGVAKAVDGVSFRIGRGETLGLVGESGCGKSVTALSILRLVQEPQGKIVAGRIVLDGTDLLSLSSAEMRKVRGKDVSMIFQEPMTSLNPVYTVGDQILEAILLHQHVTARQGKDRTIEMLHKVGIPSPEVRFGDYPHQMSGGMKQRVMIAMALSCNPKLLIADEPTTALDVTIQAQILDLMRSLQKDFGMSILLITHSLGVVAEMADHVAVMYASKIVEYAPVGELFARPKHPYTIGLLGSLPRLGEEKEVLDSIPGVVPHPLFFPEGCKFHPRCSRMEEVCKTVEPKLGPILPQHTCACHPVAREHGALVL
ncbi:MAG: ABC transporter ATP-binding protein [Planctomycetes bacterium]|nr:ABC transporter ATP-binding protein [Planctomycetota bacterium]